MKIGIMLRHFDQHEGGVKNYTRNLLEELFLLGSSYEFVLIYNDSKYINTYSNFNNVRELSINIKPKFWWDQVGIPWLHRKEKFDLIFNPKYSVPLFVKCPTIFVCHGLNSYLMPWGSKKHDAFYRKYLYPLYAAKATKIIAVSNTAKEHLINFLDIEEEKIQTTYLGIGKTFITTLNDNEQKSIRNKYNLPDKFLLYVGQIYPPKNFGRLLKAYAKAGPKRNVHLVVAGEPRWLVETDIKWIKRLNISNWVHNVGWITHSELKYFYSLAEGMLLPSLYEACPSPILEAMSVGCPVLTSDRFGTKELAGDAGILVNPEDLNDIIKGMISIIEDKPLITNLIEKGYERAKNFSWKKCAEETFYLFEHTINQPKTKNSGIKVFKLQERHKKLIINPPKERFFIN